jgi:predicted transcriptional regulator
MMMFSGEDEPATCSWLVLPFLMYSRLAPEQVLDNFMRGKIFGYIVANPGESHNLMRAHLDIPQGTLSHHLMRLEHEELVKHVPDGTMKRYYPAGMKVVPPGEHLLTNAQQNVQDVIAASPGLSQKEIAGMLDVTPAAVNFHLDVLLEKKLVRRERIGMRYRYYVQAGKETAGAAVDTSMTPAV